MVAPPDNDVLWARALHITLNGSPALTGVSLGVRESEILAVGGPRGSGKTTLLRCLSGQLLPQRGEVWFNSTPVHTMSPLARERLRRERFGWIDTEPHLVPELTAWENTALTLLLRGTAHRAAKRTALEWLERLDIGDCARKRPYALTRAECQRVAVARALAAAPSVLFADEPTATLHRADRAQVLRTLTTAARSHGITVVLATHDPDVAALADRTVTLLDGRYVNTVRLPGDELGATAAEPGGARGTEPDATTTATAPVPGAAPASASAGAPASVPDSASAGTSASVPDSTSVATSASVPDSADGSGSTDGAASAPAATDGDAAAPASADAASTSTDGSTDSSAPADGSTDTSASADGSTDTSASTDTSTDPSTSADSSPSENGSTPTGPSAPAEASVPAPAGGSPDSAPEPAAPGGSTAPAPRDTAPAPREDPAAARSATGPRPGPAADGDEPPAAGPAPQQPGAEADGARPPGDGGPAPAGAAGSSEAEGRATCSLSV